MASEEESNPSEAAPPKKGHTGLVIAAALVVLIVIAGITIFFVLKKGDGKAVEELSADAAEDPDALIPEGAHDEEELAEGEEPVGAMFPFETFIVNVSNGGYLRCLIHLEFDGRDIPKKFYPRIPIIRDGIIKILNGRSKETLLSDEGRERLKGDVRQLVNTVLHKEMVKKVFFSQYVVQK